MRILHVVPTYLPAVRYGGPIFAIHGLCRALARLGHEVEVFTTNVDGPGTSAVSLATPVILDGVKVRYFPCPLVKRVYLAPALGRALRRDTGDFDVVHLHSVFLWPTWAAARAAKSVGVPYILSPRGMLVQHLIEKRSRLAKSAWINLVERSNLKGAAAVHLTSQLELAELESFGWRLPQPVVIANGIDEPPPLSDTVSADVKKIVSRQPFVLSLGRMSWKKGLDRLLHAFARTRDGRLVIVGTDDEGLAPQLRNIATDLGIAADRLCILPRTVTGADKEHLFAASRLFVLSSYSENFGNTVLEAMRRGVPVVVTPEVGAAEIVRESGAGIVVEGDAERLGAAISRISADSTLARSMGAAGQRHVIESYSWAHIAAQMEKLYDAVRISGSRGHR